MLKKYLKLSIAWTTILTTLSSSGVFAGNWVAMPGVLQRNGAEWRLFNGSNNIIFATWLDRWFDTLYRRNNLINDFWLESLSNFLRAEKKFIDGTEGLVVRLAEPEKYHYDNYNGKQEQNTEINTGRAWVYWIWEAQWWKYNLYDAAGGKWWDCVPYYISWNNRYNRIHNWQNMHFNPNTELHRNPYNRNMNYYTLSDPTTKEIYDNITAKTINNWPNNASWALPLIDIPASSIEFYTPNYIGKYA